MSIKNILVPTDFSDHARYAAEVAASIAKKCNARIYLLHALNIPNYESNMRFEQFESIPEGLYFMKLARKRFDEFKALPFFSGVEIVEAVTFQNTYEAIAGEAEENDIDLIVMGSKGASGWKELFVGSNTERVIRLSPCPVLTIKESRPDFDIDKVLFASNFDEDSREAFKRGKELLETFDPEYHFLQVTTPRNFESSKKSYERMEGFARSVGMDKVELHIHNAETIEDGILEFQEEEPMDLNVIATHGRRGISHMVFGSLTEDVANHSNFPVLSIRIRK